MWLWVSGLALVAVLLYDVFQKRRAIIRNFPIIGHFRYDQNGTAFKASFSTPNLVAIKPSHWSIIVLTWAFGPMTPGHNPLSI